MWWNSSSRMGDLDLFYKATEANKENRLSSRYLHTYKLYYFHINQSFLITLERPDMSGKTEAGPAKYPTTSDLQSRYFLSVLSFDLFFWSCKVRIGHWPPTVSWIFFGPVKISSLQDLLSSDILSLSGKTDPYTETQLQRWVTLNYFSRLQRLIKGKVCHHDISTPTICITSILIPVIHIMKLKVKDGWPYPIFQGHRLIKDKIAITISPHLQFVLLLY